MKTAEKKPTAPAEERQTYPTQIDVRIHSLGVSGTLLANASVSLNGVFAIRGVRVIDSEKGPFVAMPAYRARDGYRDVCFPCTAEFREQLNAAVLDAYEQTLTQAQAQTAPAMQGQSM